MQASVPRDTQLVITLQRASNLPLRLGPGGAGMRAVSPTRLSGEQARGSCSARHSVVHGALALMPLPATEYRRHCRIRPHRPLH